MVYVTTDRKEFITGSYGSVNFNIPYDEERYNKIVELEEAADNAATVEELNEIEAKVKEVVDSYDLEEAKKCEIPGLVWVPKTAEYHIALGDSGCYTDLYVPKVLENLLRDNAERKISNEPIINLMIRFCDNIKPTQKRLNMLGNYITQTWTNRDEVRRLIDEEGLSQKAAEARATYMDLQITKQGLLKTTKVVEEVLKKWTIVTDDSGKPVLDDEGKPKKKLVPSYEVAYEINEETGEVTERTKFPEFLEERKFRPAIWNRGEKWENIDIKDGSGKGIDTYQYQIGKIARLKSWDSVCLKDGSMHVNGFHTGGLRYIDCYYRKGKNELLNVFLCPSQIGKLTLNGEGEMTCKEYFFHSSATIEGTTKNLYHASAYADVLVEDMKVRHAEAAAAIAEKRSNKDAKQIKVAELAAKIASL